MSSDENRNTKRILSALLVMTATFNGSFASACKRAYINKSDECESVKNKTENMPNKTEQYEESAENSQVSDSFTNRQLAGGVLAGRRSLSFAEFAWRAPGALFG